MTTPRHEAISASAGSGKTFQLAHRYIRLLASGVKPARIIALTFSRKAAGEIFDSIIKYLCLAASSEAQAKGTAGRIGALTLCQADFLGLLRDMLDSLHRLHIGTMDSFTVGIVRAFPMELGISGALQVMDSDGAQAETVRQEVLERIFNNRYVSHAAQREFLEAFKQATFGQEEKGLQRSLDTFIGQYRDFYHTLPTFEAWGQQSIIWPEGSPWLVSADDISTTAASLERLLEQHDWPEKVMQRWSKFIDSVRTFDTRSPWTRDIEYLSEKLLEDVKGLRQGNAGIKIERSKCDLSAEENQLALALLTHIMNTEIGAAYQQTKGIHRVLNQYEQFYDEMVRQKGKLTFTEIQYLLTPANNYNNGIVLSQRLDSEARLYIDYRLDCKLDHWLLDEFQDTSDLQWEVLHNLADEILQDTSGERSFFYVGDIKQAIYGWRGGNSQLFGSILEQYGNQIRQRTLSISFRSCQPVIDTINHVFKDLPQNQIPPGAIAEWEKSWQKHECQKEFVPEHGYATLLEPLSHNGEIKPSEEDRYQVTACLLKEIDPINRGISTAILVRSNDSGKRIVNYLRRECPDLNIIHEGRAAIKDNPVVSVLLSLVKFAAHPGNTLAWQHLQMSPYRAYFEKRHINRENLPLILLREIQNRGFQTFIRRWGARLEAIQPLDGFGRQRLNNLITAAGEFDSNGSRDCNTFGHFIGNYQSHEPASDDAVRVMTIHQSKGLGFDLVILPDLQGRSMVNSGDIGFITASDPINKHPIWALKMPRKIISQNDPVLARQIEASNEAACFDALCVLYVALTRAKQGLYMITSFPGKSSKTLDSAAFLKGQLTGETSPKDGPTIPIAGEDFICLHETGQHDWYTKTPPEESSLKPVILEDWPEAFHKQLSHRPRLARISPSEQAGHERRASELFSQTYYESLECGTAIHELFQKVSWFDKTVVEELIDDWQQRSSIEASLKNKSAEQFRQSLTSEEVQQALSRPDGNTELWRERHFEIVLEDQWITGAFDRVIIIRDSKDKPLKATIIDFKSDEVDSAEKLARLAEVYRPQLSLYGKALSQMLVIDPSQIKLQLLFTRPGKVYDLK